VAKLPQNIDLSMVAPKDRAADAAEIRNQAAYGLAEAARYLRLPVATLRSWVAGRDYPTGRGKGKFHPLIRPADRGPPPQLSFWNLIEAHVLRSLRSEHGVALKELRSAIEYAQRTLKIDRLLLREDLRTHAGDVFLEHYGKLKLNASGQLAMRKLFEEHLKRVEWDQWKFPVRLYPFVSSDVSAPKPIAIDPAIAFGRPVIARVGVSTGTIAERLDAGESVEALAKDYDLQQAEIEQAVVYERAA
jgi:uncharacterized protein (DUF433 family)